MRTNEPLLLGTQLAALRHDLDQARAAEATARAERERAERAEAHARGKTGDR